MADRNLLSTHVCDLVERSVSAETEVSAGHVVGDGGRDDDHWDAELPVSLPLFRQLQDRVVRLRMDIQKVTKCRLLI